VTVRRVSVIVIVAAVCWMTVFTAARALLG
jgi:hypothetical protein